MTDRSVVTGLDPAAVSTEIRIGRLGRENAATKARRLLVEGRVAVVRIDDAGLLARVRGDSASMWTVLCDPFTGRWSCGCIARGDCSHVRAVKLVTLIGGPAPPERNSHAG